MSDMPMDEQFKLNVESRKLDEKIARYKRISKECKKKMKVTKKRQKAIGDRVSGMLRQYGLEK